MSTEDNSRGKVQYGIPCPYIFEVLGYRKLKNIQSPACIA
jgi:hypothetical protein